MVRNVAGKGKTKLLSGGNPQIAKGYGDAPVQAYIAAMPGWKREIGRRIDAVIMQTVPEVQKAVKWNSPFYGKEKDSWFLSFHVFARCVKVTFFRGTSLHPIPPGASKHPEVRYLDIYEGDQFRRSIRLLGQAGQQLARGENVNDTSFSPAQLWTAETAAAYIPSMDNPFRNHYATHFQASGVCPNAPPREKPRRCVCPNARSSAPRPPSCRRTIRRRAAAPNRAGCILSVGVDGPWASLCAMVWVVEPQTGGTVRDRA